MSRSSEVMDTVQEILSYISINDINEGDLLPSERKLSESLNITRGKVRKALTQMSFENMVECKPQMGTILRSVNPHTTTFEQVLNLKGMDLQSLIEVRVPLEATAASLAAKRADDDDIKEIEAAAARYAHAVECYSAWDEENIDFHMSIIKSSKNAAIIAIMENLLNDAILSLRSTKSAYNRDRLEISLKEHDDIVQSIKEKDEKKAYDCMRFHMRKMSDLASKLDMFVS